MNSEPFPEGYIQGDIDYDLNPEPHVEIRGFVRVERADIFERGLQKPATSLDNLSWELGLEPKPPAPTPNFAGWCKIRSCTSYGNRIAFTAGLPGTGLELSFHLDTQKGIYRSITSAPHCSERGAVYKVFVCPENDWRFLDLSSFKHRFVVATTAKDRQGTVRVWRVGFDEFTRVIPAAEA